MKNKYASFSEVSAHKRKQQTLGAMQPETELS
jgi:hypothetical protein